MSSFCYLKNYKFKKLIKKCVFQFYSAPDYTVIFTIRFSQKEPTKDTSKFLIFSLLWSIYSLPRIVTWLDFTVLKEEKK